MTPAYLEISDRSARETPVFITGIPRSGTTVSCRTLQRHSRFRVAASASGANMAETRIFLRPARALRLRPDDGSAMARFFLRDGHAIEAYREIVRPLRRRSLGGLTTRIAASAGGRALGVWTWTHLHAHHLVRVFFHHAQLARAPQRLCEKTPEHVCRLAEIAATYPQAKVIFSYRHPVDVLASFRKRLHRDLANGKERKTLRWLMEPALSFARRYRRYVALAGAAHARRPGFLLFSKYEDFVSDPATAIGRICDHVSEPFEQQMLVADSPSNTSGQLSGPVRQMASRWAEHLQRAEAVQLEKELEDVMAELGYERYT